MEKKEAMKILKDFHDKSALFSVRTALDTIIPELKESEDERIRKELIEALKQLDREKCPVDTYPYLYWIDWLEKQGEQKSFARYKVGDIIYYDSFGRLVSFVIANIIEDGTDNPMYEDKDGNSIFQNDIVEQKPAWSESDENKITYLDDLVDYQSCMSNDEKKDFHRWLKSLKNRVQPKQKWSGDDEGIYQSIMDDTIQENQLDEKQIDWLRNIKFRNQWKPSKEQMDALDRAQAELCKTEYNKPICDLIDSLKELIK